MCSTITILPDSSSSYIEQENTRQEDPTLARNTQMAIIPLPFSHSLNRPTTYLDPQIVRFRIILPATSLPDTSKKTVENNHQDDAPSTSAECSLPSLHSLDENQEEPADRPRRRVHWAEDLCQISSYQVEEEEDSTIFKKKLNELLKKGAPSATPNGSLNSQSPKRSTSRATSSSANQFHLPRSPSMGRSKDHIPEDSIFRKLLTCVPVLGIALSQANQKSLRDTIAKSRRLNRTVKLINVKNHYRVASVVRDILSIAFIISKLSLILSGNIVVVATLILIAAVVHEIYGIHKNNQLMEKLQTKEHRPSDVGKLLY